MRFIIGLALILPIILTACSEGENNNIPSVMVKNPAEGGFVTQEVSIPLDEEYRGWLLKEVASEWRENASGEATLYAYIQMEPGAEKEFSLVQTKESVTDTAHAELSVRSGGQWEGAAYTADGFSFQPVESFTAPSQLTDHSYFLKYEGPGWENDKIGYRLYLDWRNAIDVFAKTSDDVVLPQVGNDGYDAYHKLADWGGDALKVGKSLGLGALGRQVEEGVLHFQYVDDTRWALTENTHLTAAFNVSYSNWRTRENSNDGVDVETRYKINTGDASTRITVKTSSPTSNIVTGLVAHEGTTKIAFAEGKWGVIATWGEQSVLSDNDLLGLAVFYQLDEVSSVAKGEFDHLITFKPATSFEYEIMAYWPARDRAENPKASFETLLRQKVRALNHGLQVM